MASAITSAFHAVACKASALGGAIPALFARDINALSPFALSNPCAVLPIIPTTLASPTSSNFGNFPRISINPSERKAHAYPNSSSASAVDATDVTLAASLSPFAPPSPMTDDRRDRARASTARDHTAPATSRITARASPSPSPSTPHASRPSPRASLARARTRARAPPRLAPPRLSPFVVVVDAPPTTDARRPRARARVSNERYSVYTTHYVCISHIQRPVSNIHRP